MAETHIHRLRRHKYSNGTEIYFCTLNCNFKIEVPLALGKNCICNICGEEFTMNEYSIKLVKPHCVKCGKTRIKDETGKTRYINKARTQVIAAEMAQNSISSLRARLGAVVSMEKDEDI